MISPYASVNWYSVVNNNWMIKIITKEQIDIMSWILYLPKELIIFILQQNLPSPCKMSILSLKDEAGWLIDAVCYSPDLQQWFITIKNMFYIIK